MPLDAAGNEPAKGKGKGGFFKKYKYWVIGGTVVLLGIIYMAIKKSNAATGSTASNAATTAANGAINPGTGYLYGSPADVAAQGGSNSSGSVPIQGSTGPAGPAGPAGPTGPAGVASPPTSVASNPGGHVVAKPGPIMVPPHSTLYTVKAGDNLSQIASKLHVSGGWQHLYSLNKNLIGSNPNVIHPGQRLRVS